MMNSIEMFVIIAGIVKLVAIHKTLAIECNFTYQLSNTELPNFKQRILRTKPVGTVLSSKFNDHFHCDEPKHSGFTEVGAHTEKFLSSSSQNCPHCDFLDDGFQEEPQCYSSTRTIRINALNNIVNKFTKLAVTLSITINQCL